MKHIVVGDIISPFPCEDALPGENEIVLDEDQQRLLADCLSEGKMVRSDFSVVEGQDAAEAMANFLNDFPSSPYYTRKYG